MEVVVSLSFCYLTITNVHLGYTLSGRQEPYSPTVRIESVFAFFDIVTSKLQTLT